ncbi:hypothetical protein H5410_062446 [Solanum commersonii]|uniref:Uncharacterized protein n=1 Tax=Solanum commersonii TaxID=4109 RepID=A0A9J5WCC0_SOLCO|nr:hypothetical protein H5410_062446 [Solanum commersonii]
MLLIIRLAANGTYSSDGTQRQKARDDTIIELSVLRNQNFWTQMFILLKISSFEDGASNKIFSIPRDQNLSILPSSLKRITISGCQKLLLEEPVGYCNMFLESLKLYHCDCIDDISPELLPRVHSLRVEHCPNITRFLIPTATESLTIWGCWNLEKLSVAVGTDESAMTSLHILFCQKLKCLPEIELSNLQVLEIYKCKKLVNGRKEWCLQRLPCLTKLEIRHDGSDEEIQHWELPSSIKRLEVSNLKTLSSQVLKSLTSLEYLYIEDSLPQIQSLQEQGRLPSSLSVLYLCHHDELHSLHLCHLTSLIRLHIRNCPNLQSLSESTLPSSLSQLTIENCNNLQSLSESALPSSLSQLTIENCDNLQSLSESALPSSLSELTISNCRNLHSLSELTLPSSLSVLIITNCPNLQSLPVKGMPSSLSTLYISNCPLLTPLLEFDKGKYWPNIAQIPTIYIDEEFMRNLELIMTRMLVVSLFPNRTAIYFGLLEMKHHLLQVEHPAQMKPKGTREKSCLMILTRLNDYLGSEKFRRSLCSSQEAKVVEPSSAEIFSYMGGAREEAMGSTETETHLLKFLKIILCFALQISVMEVGLAVGGAFISSALNVLFDRLAPQGELLKMFQKRKNDVWLLKKLRMTLPGLQAVLSDAEYKQASNQFVNHWLNELRDAVDGAENLMEQVNYEALRLKVEGRHQNLAETSNQQVSDLNLCLSDVFFLNIKEKLEDTIETLKELQEQIVGLGLKEHFGSTKQETRTPSTSLVDDSDIFGRHKEIEDLIDRLLSEDANGKDLAVVPIVGMGGAGKTTLAKVVYNNEKVKDHFGLKAWYCVSEAYDAFRITKGLLQEIGSFDLKDDNNLNQLQVKLKESLKGKKFLIVLDDVWNDNYNEWDDLRNVFVQGDTGSKILVTTHKESVALMMGNEKISMDNLSIEVSWLLFKKHAFVNMDLMGHPELEEVGKQIAAKCKGLPLALKTLAGMLRSKSEVEGWKRILRSEIWELPDNDILPALMLSYNDLPAHLKRCFSYSAIFPKDYPFRKEEIIHLWIANGLVPQEDEIFQDSGNKCFFELTSRSLFERVPKTSEGTIENLFLMHDLVNDLAQIASSKLCIRLEESQGSHVLEKGQHLSYSMGYGDFEELTPLYKLERLRTLLPTCIDHLKNCYHPLSKRVLHNILPSLTSLRALSLSHYSISEFPDALFIELKLLRFLDISRTEIQRLPDSICALYNLETLLLSDCRFLEELPLQMENLINLRHLDLSNTFSLKMLLSKLKSLQVLVGAKFLIGGSGGLRMEDLGEVENLYGSLSVLELQNVVDKREAVKAKMREKNHVDKLSLKWSESSTADNSQTERDILDGLRPHTNIKEVEITGYRGTNFPNWLGDHLFLKLVELSLSNCKDCYSLPALGQLPCLKFLSIRGMLGITEVMEEFYGSPSSKKAFKSLEKLEFEEMPEWKQWHIRGSGEFPILEKLSIHKCRKLMGKLPENLSSLTELSISECPQLNLETSIQLSSVQIFYVFDYPLFRSQFEGMKQIVELYIRDCNSLTSLPFSILPSTLKEIRISCCQKLKLEEPVGHCNMFLEELTLLDCDCIDDISPELLPTARGLRVQRCQNLTRILIPTATESLYIWNCENLEILSVAVGTHESAMTYLGIDGCWKLKTLPDHMQELLPSLNILHLHHLEIEFFPEGGLPFNLQKLEICSCTKLVNGRKEWRLQRLRELHIRHDRSDEEILAGENWELPSSITSLRIENLKTLSSQVLKSLTSLKHLSIRDLPQIQSLLEEGRLPSSLSELHLEFHDELHSLHLCHLTSLLRLKINNCPNLQSLSESALPSSLSKLTIECCPNLQSLSESVLPSSLSELYILYCPNLQSLPYGESIAPGQNLLIFPRFGEPELFDLVFAVLKLQSTKIMNAVYYDFLEMKHDLLQMEHTALVELKVRRLQFPSHTAVYCGFLEMKHDLLQMGHPALMYPKVR